MPLSRIAGNLVLLLGSILVTLVFAEVALRVLGIAYPYWSRVDPLTGFSPRPGVSGMLHDEGDAFVSINNAGFRDRDHTIEKPEGTLRVAVLGDSYTEGKQVDVTETFWAVAERELAACPALQDQRIEFVNFGVSGYGTAQQWLLLERVWPYQPDAVVLAFTAGNDVLNNSRELEGAADKPYVEEVNGTLTPNFSFRERPFYKRQQSTTTRLMLSVIDRSRVAQLLAQTMRVVRRHRVVNTTATVETGSQAFLREFGLDPDIYDAPRSPAYARAWHLTERLISDMAAQAAKHRSRFTVMTVPISIQTHPDPAAREEAKRILGVDDLFYAEERIVDLGRCQKFPVLALGRPMQKIAQEKNVFFNGSPRMPPGSGHWNAKGHAEAGRLLAQFLCAQE